MTTRILLDWSGRGDCPAAAVGPPEPCIHCNRPALLREPGTGRPCHKVCAEADIGRRADAHTQHAA
jgi:hypothetical protein